MEVLAPVGNEEMLVAVVRSGADAVYLGADGFNARRGAENFNDEKLKNAVAYCHIRGVKVYLTLNIVVRDDEIERAVSLARYAEKIGVDGVIVQDLGLAALLKNATPDLPLHASTQMSVQSEGALPILKEMGFKRVVVARELNKEALQKICKTAKELDLEIEVFVHGALCMCVSGQCMLSSMLGTRSGNRGLCAGTCRLPFTARGKEDDYALSLKDLSLIEHVNELKKMGVASLKIEGRMKRPEYAQIATAAVKGAVQGEDVAEATFLLRNVFSRSGFTDGYFTDNRCDMFGIRTKEDALKAKEALPKIHALYRTERQSVKIKMEFFADFEKEISLVLCDGENTVTVKGEKPQKAQNRAATKEDVALSLNKLGGTPFYAEETTVNLTEGLFISAAELNAIRRRGVEALSKARYKEKENTPFEIKKPKDAAHGFRGYILSVKSSEQLEKIDDFDKVYAVCVPAHKPFVPRGNKKVFINLCQGIANEQTLLKQFERARELGITGAVVHNLSHVTLCRKFGFEMLGGIGLNLYNSFTAEKLQNFGINTLTISPEMHVGNAKKIKATEKTALFAYGKMPLMTVRNCPVKAQIGCEKCGGKGRLTDRTGRVFPVYCSGDFAEILNCVPLYLADKSDDVGQFDYLYLSFTDEDGNAVKAVLDSYEKGTPSKTEFTRGLYYRTVE